MDLFDLYANLTLDTDDYESGMQDAKSATTDAGDAAESAANSGFTVMKEVLANLATSVINELVSKCKELATSVYEIGTETETSFAQLETIAGAENIDALTESLSDLSVQTGISSSDLALTAYNAISAGSSAEDAAGMVETAAKLATAGFTDTDSALSVLSTTINAYGMSAEEASTISDSLIQVQNLGVTTVAELSSAMGKAISTASAYSIDLYNLEAAYISTTKAGISTEESTTYLSSMFNELGDSGSDVAAILSEETGQTFGQLMDSGYNLADVLDILYESVDGDSEALMNLWGSAEAGKAASAIISQGLDTFEESLNAVSDAAGSTEEAYETMTDTLEWKVSQLKTVGEAMMLELYEGAESQLGDLVTWASDAGMEILDGFEEGGISGALDAVASIVSETVSDFMHALTEYLPTILEQGYEMLTNFATGATEAMPEIISVVTEIVTTFVDYVIEYLPEIISLGVDLLLSLIVGISEAIPDLIASIPAIITAIIQTISENLPKFVSAGGEVLGNLIEGIIAAIPDLVASLPQIITAIVTGLASLMSAIVEAGANIIAGLVEGILGAMGKVTEAASEVGSTLLSAVKSFFGINSPSTVMAEQGEYITEGLIGGLESMPEDVEKILDEVDVIVNDWAEELFEDMSGWMSTIQDSVLEWLNGFQEETLVEWQESFMQFLSQWLILIQETITLWLTAEAEEIELWLLTGKETFELFLSDIQTLFTEGIAVIETLLLERLAAITEQVSTWESSTVQQFYDMGVNVMQGLINGIDSKISALYSKIKSALSGLVAQAEAELGIASPSKVFAKIGGYMAEGLGEGWDNEIEDITAGIVSDLDFGISNIDTSSSAIGAALGMSGKSAMARGSVSVVQNIYSQAQTAADLLREARWQQERAVLRGV